MNFLQLTKGLKGRYNFQTQFPDTISRHNFQTQFPDTTLTSTHQQLLYHIVFSTKNRRPWLTDAIRSEIFAYMAGICKESGGYSIIINGYVDHVHLLVRIPAKISVSEFAGKLKSNSSKHINDMSGLIQKFGWQDGFGAFTVSVSAKDRVYQYIANQVEHHSKVTFECEYLDLLQKHEVENDPKFVFD